MDNRLIGMIALVLVFGLISFGCLGIGESNGSTQSVSPAYPAPSLGAPAKSASAGSAEFITSDYYSGSVPSDQILTKSSTATLKVPEGSLEAKYTAVRTMLTSEGGQISDVQYSEYSDRKQYTITAKVPPGRFDGVISQLKDFGEVKDLSVSIEDVTKQYTDLNTRIANKEIELERLRILYNSTGNISDLLGVERELTRVESELDLLKGEKQYLESLISRSSISIAVYEEKPATTSLGLSLESLAQSFFGAMSGAVIVLALGAGFLLPFVLVIVVLWFIWKMVKKKPVSAEANSTAAAAKKK